MFPIELEARSPVDRRDALRVGGFDRRAVDRATARVAAIHAALVSDPAILVAILDRTASTINEPHRVR